MRVLGIRVAPRCIYFCIIEEENGQINILTVDTINVPVALDLPRCLSYIRTNVLSIIKEYGVKQAGLKMYEGNTQRVDTFRLNMEGVILELLADSSVEKYFQAYIKSIASRLESTPQEIKDMLSGNMVPFDIVDWEKYKKEHREAILTGLASLFI
jgi:Holliday junction resolvasome RuvABC endonuclease subunit